MTVVDRRMFDELAHCLRVNKVGNALILQIADVCARANRNFKRDWFLSAAGYTTLTSKVKALKLGNKIKVIPVDVVTSPPGHGKSEFTPAVWPKPTVPAGWDGIEPGPEQSFAPPKKLK